MKMTNLTDIIFGKICDGNIHEILCDNISDIDTMRKFHNYIKNKLITFACCHFERKTLLDISVGRGGDFFKWKENQVDIVLGFDNHEESLNEARKRLKTQISKHDKIPFTKYYNLDANDCDICSKLSKLESTIKGLKKLNGVAQYDIVSCQFAFHYFAGNLDHIISFISNKLKDGGFFIGTASDGDLIYKNLAKCDISLGILNICKVNEEKYKFYINTKSNTYFDVQGVSNEFFTFKQQLIDKCKLHNLIVYNINSFYDHYMSSNFSMSTQEKIISFLNFSFVFQKFN
jgi:SAM-dependent methyltransferase